ERVLVERQMRSRSMVVVHVCPEPPLKVPLVEYDHVIEQLATDCPDHALDVRILPGRTRGRNHLGDAHSFDPLAEDDAVGRVAISDEIARSLFPWECLVSLLRGPRSRRRISDGEMDDAAALLSQNDQNEEHAECRRRYDEEIHRR